MKSYWRKILFSAVISIVVGDEKTNVEVIDLGAIDDNNSDDFGEYTVNIKLPGSWAESEVLHHTIKTSKSRDTSVKDKIYRRLMEIETKAFGYEQSLKWINSTVQTHSKLFKDGKLNRNDLDVTPINTEGGYLNRLDQLQNFTSQINHRVRALEVKSGTDPHNFMKEMAFLYNDRIEILQRDVFEIMQKMNKYNAKIDIIQSDTIYNKGKSITEKSEILHLKEIVKVLQSKLDRLINMVFVTGESRNKRSKYPDDSSSVSSDSAADSSSYVADDGNENYSMFRDIIENELDAFEMRILSNLSDSRDSSIRFTQEMIMSLDSSLGDRIKTLETTQKPVRGDAIDSRLTNLEDGQAFLVQRIQDIKSLKDEIVSEVVQETKTKSSGPIATDSFGNIVESRCKCTMPSEISEAIIRLQMRTDVLKSDQKILTDELQMRIREINTLTKSVADLREERTKIHETIGSYQRQVIHLMEVTDGYFNKITYLEEKVAEHDSNLATSSKLTMFNHERLMNAPFRCASGGRKWGPYCFMLSKDVRTWPEARVKCEKLGGSLAIIKDGETNKFITNLIRSGKHDTSFWIGLHDRDSENKFTWVDESPLTDYTNWYHNEPTPNVEGEDCVHVTGAMWKYQWNDRECDHKFRYICQI